MLAAVWDLLGSRLSEVTVSPGRLEIFSTSIGFVRFWLILGLPLLGLILVDGVRKGTVSRNLPVAGVLGVCLAVVCGFGYSAMRLDGTRESDSLMLTRWTVLGARQELVPLAGLRSVDLASGTIKAATRNGTPVGSDRTGYFVRLVTDARHSVEATPMSARHGRERSVVVIRELLAFLDEHPALQGRALKTNLDRLGL
ncbi:hypothetical protein [Tropicibacter sp. S64]|uniref:hypothetical protein n=1 Tax=Tropicibacter sp. S64 TaxID=3415122 RepID=UPI003C7AD6D4